ncbi:hypothetical protein QYH69_30885 [Paraburkholderia sp. SARCC-3016]|nr:hypothetical protein [Paraburkholderia sp. SARCC-3016]MDQ7981631.1 hypothetical protein [Paraburkholderia sp. SARCC-3016]
MLYAVSGVMWVEVGQEALVVPPQRAVWLPPESTHSIRQVRAAADRAVVPACRCEGRLPGRCAGNARPCGAADVKGRCLRQKTGG